MATKGLEWAKAMAEGAAIMGAAGAGLGKLVDKASGNKEDGNGTAIGGLLGGLIGLVLGAVDDDERNT